MENNKNRSFVILGAGRFGTSVATTLYSLGHEVLLIDRNEDVIQSMTKYCTHAVIGDCCDEDTLVSLGVRNFDAAVVAIGADFQSSVLVTVMLKEMGVPYVIAKVQSERHAKVLEKIGADNVIFPEHDSGVRLAHNLSLNNFVDYMELSPDYSIAEISCPEGWIGKSINELNVRARFGVNIMAVKNGGHINVSPSPQERFEADDMLIVLASNDDLNKLR